MKTLMALVAISIGFGSTAFADDFVCELRSTDGSYNVGYTPEYHGRKATVELKGYRCEGIISNSDIRVYLYEPGETDDDDATKTAGPIHLGARVDRPDLGISCRCGLQ